MRVFVRGYKKKEKSDVNRKNGVYFMFTKLRSKS